MNSLSNIAGIGPKTIEKLQKIGIEEPSDLIYHFPRDYIDFTHTSSIDNAPFEENITIKAKLIAFKNIYSRNGKNVQIANVKDNTGSLTLFWINQPYLQKSLKIGSILNLAGQIKLYKGQKTIFFPKIGSNKTGKIIPVYPETKGLNSAWFNKIISANFIQITKNIKDNLPSDIKKNYQLANLTSSLKKIHLPNTLSDIDCARQRLSVDELLNIHLTSILQKKHWQSIQNHHQLKLNKTINNKINNFIKKLPFKLTSDQNKVWSQIQKDLSSKKITNRLLQGDVGSGKTIIAILSAYLSHLNNKISVIIAPTQILSLQHYQNFKKLLPKVPIKLMTAGHSKNMSDIKPNTIIISTHSIFYHYKPIKNKIALLVIDEQHKFGVEQRGKLLNQTSPPHTITMTATPIPRSIELTVLGNLDISTIKKPPKTRIKIKSYLTPVDKQVKCYHWLVRQLQTDHSQAYIVCPFIENSDKMDQVVSVEQEYKNVKNMFPSLNIGLLHGKLKADDKQRVVSDFLKKKYDILVTTPIIEVGIDIKNANYMIINSADRFGLSQLHQLRGRIGRGNKQAYCFFFTSSLNQKTTNRLDFISKNTNCFKIAKYDLESRGPGTIFSTLQHGFPQLKLSNLSDIDLNKKVRTIAKDILENYPKSVNNILSEDLIKPITQN